MPSPSQFRTGFQLTKEQLTFHHFKLTKQPEIKHVVMKTNRLYHFPLLFTFTRQDGEATKKDQNKLLEELKQSLCKESKIVLSEYGSPYECSIDEKSFHVIDDDEEDNKVVKIAANGVGKRRMDIPTEAQKHKEEQKQKNVDPEEVKRRVEKAKTKGYRVTKSHFNSGTCSSCQEPLRIGDYICKNEKAEKSGWAHLDCVFAPSKADDDEKAEHVKQEETPSKKKASKRAETDDKKDQSEKSSRRKRTKASSES
jgi:hypothetical protein